MFEQCEVFRVLEVFRSLEQCEVFASSEVFRFLEQCEAFGSFVLFVSFVLVSVSVCPTNDSSSSSSFYSSHSHSPIDEAEEDPRSPSISPSNSSASSSESLGHLSSSQKRKRMRMTPEQLKVLQKAFVQNPMPSASCRSLLAQRLGMDCRSVQIWFQNRRAKLKQMDRKRDEDPEAVGEAETDFAADSANNPSPNPSPEPIIFTQPQPQQRVRSFSAVGMEAIRFCHSPADLAPAYSVSPRGVTHMEACAFPRDEQLYFGNDGIYQGDNSPFFSAAGKGNLDDFCLPPCTTPG